MSKPSVGVPETVTRPSALANQEWHEACTQMLLVAEELQKLLVEYRRERSEFERWAAEERVSIARERAQIENRS